MQLQELIQVPNKLRDQDWENRFLHALAESQIGILNETPVNGPDGWPYLLAETSSGPDAELTQKVLHWLSTRGIGLVINPEKEFPDYVLTYGMIWFFRQTSRFYLHTKEASEPKSREVELDSIHVAGPPTEEYLPTYVRKVLSEFFRDQGLLKVKILVLGTAESSFDLAFSSESLGTPPAAEHRGILEAISWFLPPHYSIILASEAGLPPFVDL